MQVSVFSWKRRSDMDIAKLSTMMSMSKIQSDVGMAMLSKQLDTFKDLGQGLVETLDATPSASAMELSVNPAVGGNIDISV